MRFESGEGPSDWEMRKIVGGIVALRCSRSGSVVGQLKRREGAESVSLWCLQRRE